MTETQQDDGRDADKVLREGNVEITTHDGHPAIKIGDELLELRTGIAIEDEDERLGYRNVDTKAEVDADDHAWWNVVKDEEPGEVEHPRVSIEPMVID